VKACDVVVVDDDVADDDGAEIELHLHSLISLLSLLSN